MNRQRNIMSDSGFLMRIGAVFIAASLTVFAWLDSWAYTTPDAVEMISTAGELFTQRQFGFRLVWLGFFAWALAHLNHQRHQEPSNGGKWRLMVFVGLACALGFGRLGAGAPLQAFVSTSLLVMGVWTVLKGLVDRDDYQPIWKKHRIVAGRTIICSLILDLFIVVQDAQAEQAGLPVDGGEGQVALAMIRLARMASVAIPLFLLMHHEIRENAVDKPILIKWVPKIFLFGAVALPLLLVLPPAVWMPLKYAMPLGSDAVLIGVGFTAYWALKKGLWVEFFGWLLLAISMNMGLLMGAYAFDGPFSAPEFVGEFLDAGRRLLRSIHVEVIVAATALIVADRWRRSTGVFTRIVADSHELKRGE